MKTCSVDNCENAGRLTKGLCNKHYMRMLRHGQTDGGRFGKSPHTRVAHPLYGAWSQMRNRCNNPNNYSYGRYGAIGIRVCERWEKDFWNFVSDMGARPDGMTLDRIDPNGWYEPNNCRWADATTQRNNQDHYRSENAKKKQSKKAFERWAKKNANKTMCNNGLHAWVPENIYTKPSGGRYCRACRQESSRRAYSRKIASKA